MKLRRSVFQFYCKNQLWDFHFLEIKFLKCFIKEGKKFRAFNLLLKVKSKFLKLVKTHTLVRQRKFYSFHLFFQLIINSLIIPFSLAPKRIGRKLVYFYSDENNIKRMVDRVILWLVKSIKERDEKKLVDRIVNELYETIRGRSKTIEKYKVFYSLGSTDIKNYIFGRTKRLQKKIYLNRTNLNNVAIFYKNLRRRRSFRKGSNVKGRKRR